MDVVRRNTDYALRLVLNLARNYGNGPISTRMAASKEDVPYQLASKLMQRLNKAKLVKSCMGPKGGFVLGREPSKICLLDVVETIQGPITINRCLLSLDFCPKHRDCPIRAKLAELQKSINNSLAGITLDELLQNGHTKCKSKARKRKRIKR